MRAANESYALKMNIIVTTLLTFMGDKDDPKVIICILNNNDIINTYSMKQPDLYYF